MQIKTIKHMITNKLDSWLSTISDANLRERVKRTLLVSGGSITSLLLNQPVNDYDVYIQNRDVLYDLAKYYVGDSAEIWRGWLDKGSLLQDLSNNQRESNGIREIAIKNLQDNQVKIFFSQESHNGMAGRKYEVSDNHPYQRAFISPNAISLTGDIQIVCRFSGSPEEIHKTFDFIHATNYFTFKEGKPTLTLNQAALESILTKQLHYQGSLYPITSIIRMKKFINRGWSINAGEILKILFQVSELNLKDYGVLEEQLIGVDVLHFQKVIEVLHGVPPEKLNAPYISSIIDKIFDDLTEEEPEN